VDLHSTAGKVATGPAGSRLGMVEQGPDSNGASGPSLQGSDRSAGVVLLVVQLVFPGRVALGGTTGTGGTGMVLRVQAGLVASGWWPQLCWPGLYVRRLLLGCGPESGERGQEGCHLRSRSLAEMCANTLPLPG